MMDRLQYVNHADRPNLVVVWDKQEEHVLAYLKPKWIEARVDLFTDYGKGGPTKSRGTLSVPDSAIENSFEGVVCVIDQRKRGCITQHHVCRPNRTTDWVSITDLATLRSAIADYEGIVPVAAMPKVPDMSALHAVNHGNFKRKHAQEQQQQQHQVAGGGGGKQGGAASGEQPWHGAACEQPQRGAAGGHQRWRHMAGGWRCGCLVWWTMDACRIWGGKQVWGVAAH
jgi:hypothetical protein